MKLIVYINRLIDQIVDRLIGIKLLLAAAQTEITELSYRIN